ncbi:hypothetical protein LCGC14_1325300, partial [marine sediment metagenome]
MYFPLGAVIITASVFNFLLGLSVLRQRRNKSSYSFAVFAIATSLWTASNIVLFFDTNIITVRLTYAFGALVMSASLSFVIIFTRKKTKFAYISYLLGSAAFFVSLTPLVISKVISYSITGQNVAHGILFEVISSWFLITLILDLAILIYTKRQVSGFFKNQIRFVILGITLFGTIALTVSFFLPILGISKFMMLDSPSSLFFVGFSAYAIIRHRLMDIRLLVLKSIAYTITLILIAGTYVTSFYLVIERFRQEVGPTLNILILLTIAFSFNPLRNFVAKATDKIFFKNRYNFRELLGKINDIANKNSRSISGTSIKVLKTLIEDMRINKAAIVLTSGSSLSEIKALGYKSKSKNLWDKPVKIAADHGTTVVYDELEEDSDEKDILRKADIEVLVPILSEQEALSINEKGMEVEKKGVVQAVLALGPKKSGDMYTSEDLKLLELAAPQLALAFENAKSFKEKEQRIAELKSINKMFQRIEQFIDLDKLLKQIVNEA